MKSKTRKIICVLLTFLSLSLLGNVALFLKNEGDKPKQKKLVAMYLENESGGYDLSSQSKFPTDGYVLNTEKSTCKNGGTLSQDPTTKKLSLSVSNSDQCNVYFDKVKALTSNDILAKFGGTSQGVRSSFDAAATTDEGIFEMEDDYGTSYYYRGAVENNYVKYGVNKDGQEMWWRIIRINGDGSIRMIYDGTQGYANGANGGWQRFLNSSQKFNAQRNDAKYVGWMYGPADTKASASKEQAQTNSADSDAKKVVDMWYKENIEDTGYGENVSDAIFCNDRSTPGKTVTGVSYDTGLGYGTNVTCYGTYGRFVNNGSAKTNIQPQFTCPNKNDAFTVSDTAKGNGSLTYPIVLITADEIVAAGSGKAFTTNSKYYLHHGGGYLWSLSPYYMNTNGYALVFIINDSGMTTGETVNNAGEPLPQS